jgi:hypothetical protein
VQAGHGSDGAENAGAVPERGGGRCRRARGEQRAGGSWRRCWARGLEGVGAEAGAGASRDKQRRARRRRVAHSGVSAGRAQAATGSVCGEVTRGAGGATARRLRADPHGSSETARGERRRPLRRKQRTRSDGTANCS